MGFSKQEYQSGLPFPYPGDLPDPGIEPRSPALQVDSLPSQPPGKPSTATGKPSMWFHVVNVSVCFLFVCLFLILKSLIPTCVPKHEPPSHLPPHNISVGHPHAPAPSMLYPASDKTGDSILT